MKKFIALILCMLTVICALSLMASATTIVYPEIQNDLDYYQMDVGNEYLVYGRNTYCATSDLSFISYTIAGNVSNTNKKAVYSYINSPSSSYAKYHAFSAVNASTGATISALSKTRGTGTNESALESYVEKAATYSSSSRPTITLTATLEAYYSATNWIVSYPNITAAC